MMLPIKKLLGPKTLVSLAIVYVLLITIAFLLPGKNIPPTGLPLDKIVHVAIHAGLAFIWLLYVYRKQDFKIKKMQVLWVLFACILYGIIIEALQESFISLRHADAWDLVANSIGIVFGTMLFYKSQNYFRNQI